MAGYNEILEGRFNRLLQKFLAIKGPAPVSSVAPDWMAVFALPLDSVENRYLEGTQRYGVVATLGSGGAGNTAKAMLHNIIASNVLVVVEKIMVTATAAGSAFRIRMRSARREGPGDILDFGIGFGTTNSGFDARGPQTPASTWTGDNSNFVNPGVQIIPDLNLASVPIAPFDVILNVNQEIPLGPGNALTIENATANLGFQCGMVFRERIFGDAER